VERSPRLLVIGGASLDTLHFAGRTTPSAGGAGLYTGLAAQRAGARVTMHGPRPEPMPEVLAPAVERLEWLGPAVPPESLPRFEIAHDGVGRQEMLSFDWGAESLLTPESAPQTPADWVYCVALADAGLQRRFLRHYKQRGRRVACGTYGRLASDFRDVLLDVVAESDAFFCNEREAETLFGGLDRAFARPGRLLFVTRGARGAAVFQGQHRTDVPGVPARELDPTGAGDAFCGTTLARLAGGEHPVEAARRAIAAAAEMIGDVGPAALLRPPPTPEPPEDPRVRVDEERLARLAGLLAGRPEVRALDFSGEGFPAVGDPRALAFFFAATLQQFGFWSLGAERRWSAPLLAPLGGLSRKGSDYLWSAYARWMRERAADLEPAQQAALTADGLAHRLRDDDGGSPMPALDLHLGQARAYGRDMLALGWTPRAMLERANATETPVATLLAALDHVGGYKEDPLRKKSALLALILRERPEGFLRRVAGEDLPAIVDYHVQRSCLRLGLLVVEDAALAGRLRGRRVLPPEDEAAVRRASFRAMGTLARESGRGMGACDAFLFTMRRRCPEMSEPECAACVADPVCAHRKELFQPVLRTTFY
jgi:sugar/nucleoside kinase (ribokinase family)